MADLLAQEVNSVVECPICNDIMTIPKVLPCQHSFCLHCLQQHWPDKQDGELVSCPICRNEFLVPVGGLEKLSDNFVIKKLISAQSATKKKVGPRAVMCDTHPDEEIKIYCKECKKGVCITCFIRNHNTHTCSDVRECVDFKTRLRTIIGEDVCKRTIDIDHQIANLKMRIESFTAKVDSVEGKMRRRTEEVKRLVDEHLQRLLEKLDLHKSRIIGGMQKSLKRLDEMKRDLESLHRQCRGTVVDLSSLDSVVLVEAKELISSRIIGNSTNFVIQFFPSNFPASKSSGTDNVVGDLSG